MVSTPIDVTLEVGAKKVFATASEWPGWCRSGRTAEAALSALADYSERYRVVTGYVGVRFPAKAGDLLRVVEEVPGNATTDFGAPGVVPLLDTAPLSAAQAKRRVALVRAAWRVLDEVAAGAPATLRKGPRGGGRDRDDVVQHVWNAEAAYARKIGVKMQAPADAAQAAAIRDAIVEALLAGGRPEAAADEPPARGRRSSGWPVRYAASRIAWHVLDHAWEIEDKSDPT